MTIFKLKLQFFFAYDCVNAIFHTNKLYIIEYVCVIERQPTEPAHWTNKMAALCVCVCVCVYV
jgi:hypothetical protein